MMKERPIIFSGDSVRAILDGRKTMTRRVIKPQPFYTLRPGDTIPQEKGMHLLYHGRPHKVIWWKEAKDYRIASLKLLSPYGKPGDRLWVRETWGEDTHGLHYKSDWTNRKPHSMEEENETWQTPIFMPRWASRILLEITDIRVGRINDISMDDIEAEGINFPDFQGRSAEFIHLWDSINKKRGYGWDVNPWVWIITFRRIKP